MTARALVLVFLIAGTSGARAEEQDPPVELDIAPEDVEPKPYGPEEPPPEPEPEPEPEPAPIPEPVVEEGGSGPIGGRIWSYLRADDDDGDLQQVSASAWLEASPRFGPSTAKLALSVDYLETSIAGTTGLRARVREAHVTYKKSGWLLRLGQQIIPWGSGDGVNPTDFLTARDPTFLSADSEDQREGAISLLVSKVFAGPGLELTLVVTPLHARSKLLIPPNTLPPGITMDGPTRSLELADTEVAARMKLSGSGWDLALVGFRGFQHTPELELAAEDRISQVHHPILGAGLDGSASIGKLTFRLEAAYVATENPNGAQPTIQPSYAAGVLGVERPFFERLRVSVQIIGRLHPRYRSPETLPETSVIEVARRQVAIANALLLDYVDKRRGAATARIAYTTADDKLELEVLAAVSFFIGDYLVRPRIAYQLTDALKVEAGYERYGGPRTRPLGALRPFSGAFLQASFTF